MSQIDKSTLDPTSSQQLRGKDNSRAWQRDFRIAALAENVEDIFKGMHEEPECPDPGAYGLNAQGEDLDEEMVEFSYDIVKKVEADEHQWMASSTPTKTTKTVKETIHVKKKVSDMTDEDKAKYKEYRKGKGRSTLDNEGIAALVAQGTKRQYGLDFSGRLGLYKFALEHYTTCRKLSNKAMGLLLRWTAPALRAQLHNMTNPKEAYDYLLARYNVSDARAREIATNSFESIHISQFQTAQEYINAIENARQDLNDANGDCGDTVVIDKIVRGLEPLWPGQTTGYQPFLTQYRMMQDAWNLQLSLDQIITQVLTYESSNKPRQGRVEGRTQRNNASKGEGRASAETTNRRNNAYNNGSNKGNKQCSVHGTCTHDSAQCWSLHPEKKPNANKKFGSKPTIANATIDDEDFADLLQNARSAHEGSFLED